VFAYRFDWDEEPSVLGADLGEMLGAAHVMEVPFVFGHWDLGPNSKLLFDEDNAPARLALSEKMQSYWGQFAWTGSPGRGHDGKQPAWSAWDPSQPTAGKYIVFDTPAGGGIRMAHELESTSALIAELSRDPAWDEPARCALLAEWTRDVPTVVAHSGELGCRAPEVARED
jgi:para-nitrobenzyl esterase